MGRYPFLISVPHGGTIVPEPVASLVALSPGELRYYSDPSTRLIYSFRDRVACYRDTEISRMIVDLNRPPYHLPPKHPDGVVKVRTVHGTPVFQGGVTPEITLIHQLLMAYYFPYHADLDRLLDPGRIALALDCHSMLPTGPPTHRDAGRPRPLVGHPLHLPGCVDHGPCPGLPGGARPGGRGRHQPALLGRVHHQCPLLAPGYPLDPDRGITGTLRDRVR
ncbi:MAG: N-formylglutamate amidohydrolase [Methanomicrobiales archaeon]|nr:N-formylglutamate amidohydrolase [Methanomicrobiales archaeon]